MQIMNKRPSPETTRCQRAERIQTMVARACTKPFPVGARALTFVGYAPLHRQERERNGDRLMTLDAKQDAVIFDQAQSIVREFVERIAGVAL